MSDNLNDIDSTCLRLEDIANEQRKKLLTLNTYSSQSGNEYGANHPNALMTKGGSDDPLNIKGKGTGQLYDTSNGGGYYDIYGRVDVQDSGRLRLLLKNKYTKDNQYDCFI